MPTTPEPVVFLPDGTNVPHPISEVIIDDLVIPADIVLADGFVITADGLVSMRLKAKSHVTLRYSDDNVPAAARFEVKP